MTPTLRSPDSAPQPFAAPDAETLVAFLRSPAGAEALAALAARDLGDSHTIGLLSELRRRFAPAEAAALLTQARLRQRAASTHSDTAKFPWAERMLFVAEALEQATAWPVARHRAERLHALAPPGLVLDLGCGIGGDLLALAHLRPATGYESDPLRAAMARANVDAVFGTAGPPHPVEVVTGDWVAALAAGTLPAAAAAFADPARRQEGRQGVRRVFGLEEMTPPLAALLRLQAQVPALAVKVAPGVQAADLPPGAAVEFVSHAGVCKEAVLWFGPLAETEGPAAREGSPLEGARRWASVHDGVAWHALPAHGVPPPLGPLAPGQALYEPDPAVIRAGALAELCALLGAHLFAPDIAYLVSDAVGEDAQATPFARAFRVREVFPFALKRLNRRLAELGIGQVEIKKRGFPVEPEEMRRRLKLAGSGRAVVFLTRRGDEHWVILGEREEP
jgi:hypothetical protein